MTSLHGLFRFTLAWILALTAGCGLFGANFPPGNAGGSFYEEPSGLPAFSEVMNHRRESMQQGIEQHIETNLNVLKELYQSSATLREQLKNQKMRIDSIAMSGLKISPTDAELILEGVHWLIELDVLLFNMWTTYRNYLPYSSEPDSYAPSRGASLIDTPVRTKGGLVALTAEIIRMDNAVAVIKLLEDEPVLTQWLNRGDETRGIPPESFDRMLGSFRDPDRRALIQFHLKAIFGDQTTLSELMRNDSDFASLVAILRESKTARHIIDESTLSRQWQFAKAIALRSFALAFSPVLEGYIALRFRESGAGDLEELSYLKTAYNVPGQIFDLLKPLDLLLMEDARYGVAGQGYNQAAVFLGDYHWLRDQGVTTHPAFLTNAGLLRQGNTFVMLLPQGIRFVTYEEILSAQDLAVLRFREFEHLGLEDADKETDARKTADTSFPGADATDGGVGSDLDGGGPLVESVPSQPIPAGHVLSKIQSRINKMTRRANAESTLEPGDTFRPSASLNQARSCLGDADIEKKVRNVFKIMGSPDFLNPRAAGEGEYAAQLVHAIYGQECLQTTARPGQSAPSWFRILSGFEKNRAKRLLKIVTENAAVPEENKFISVFREHIKKRKRQQK
jgi:hypothetical protein